MNWSRAEVKPLAGGYSGSLLLLANGWKGKSRTEPLVLKVDEFSQMRRELAGYHQVKDFFGKHVPTFGYPVSEQGSIGVGMELAAMEGRPRTLQANFEDVETDEQLAGFLRQLDKALDLLSQKLYRNTEEPSWIAPYRAFGIHTEKQVTYLARNAQTIISYFEGEFAADGMVDPDQVTKLMKLVGRNPDGVDGRVCLVHGDLNYANIICDEADNVWFIDWTHCGHLPIELDFAKLESDAKFVMSKAFDNSDLPRLRLLEEYFVEHDIPAEANSLPDRLKFAKWDLRFRKVLETVRRIRLACSALTDTDDDLVYRIALLRYATHTLSFDQRRGQGECAPPQLTTSRSVPSGPRAIRPVKGSRSTSRRGCSTAPTMRLRITSIRQCSSTTALPTRGAGRIRKSSPASATTTALLPSSTGAISGCPGTRAAGRESRVGVCSAFGGRTFRSCP
jgi:hypothetical protein